jgi:3-hydroxyisobutyrate dehydrogenase-like beta-hydroxyacid dehydrogenase
MKAGVVGLGNMGGRMARRLVDGGETVSGYDLDPARAGEVGVVSAESPAALAAESDAILLSLPDSSVIEAVVGELEPDLREGHVVVDLSTAAPDSTTTIHERLAARGIAYLDAGISGGAAAAEAGTLTIMVGGEAAALDRVRPLLGHVASHVHHMGASGAGHTAKLLNNFLNGISLAATAEVMVAAKRSGLDLETFLEVVNASSGVNFATLNRFPHIIKGDYLEGGLTGRLMAKDIRLYLEHVARLGVPTFNGPACLAAFEVANALGYEDQISNRVVDGIGDLAGGVRLQDPIT